MTFGCDANLAVRFCLGGLIAMAVAGCSVNEYGTSHLSRWETDTHIGYQLVASGVHLDTRDTSPSLTIGRYEAFYLFPSTCEDIADIASLASGDLFDQVLPQATLRRTFGMELAAGPQEAGINIGFRERTRILTIDRSMSIQRSLVLNGENFRDSRLLFSGNCAAEY